MTLIFSLLVLRILYISWRRRLEQYCGQLEIHLSFFWLVLYCFCALSELSCSLERIIISSACFSRSFKLLFYLEYYIGRPPFPFSRSPQYLLGTPISIPSSSNWKRLDRQCCTAYLLDSPYRLLHTQPLGTKPAPWVRIKATFSIPPIIRFGTRSIRRGSMLWYSPWRLASGHWSQALIDQSKFQKIAFF